MKKLDNDLKKDIEDLLKIFPSSQETKEFNHRKTKLKSPTWGAKSAETKFGRKHLLLSNIQNFTDNYFEIPFLGGILEVSCQNVSVGGLLGRVGSQVEG